MSIRQFLITVVSSAAITAPAFAEPLEDPLKSPMWTEMRTRYFGDAKVVFDDRVKVSVPTVVENQAQVPVTADARQITGVEKLIVFADLNPIQHVLTLSPRTAKAFVAFRMKIEQATPVRAAVLTTEGVWHVGGVQLEAAGGGCSAPAATRGLANWHDTTGQTQGRSWREADGTVRLRVRIRHPMDTGLAKDNQPAFFIERLTVRSTTGDEIAGLDLYEPVSEDPTLTLLVGRTPVDEGITLDARDNSGGIFRAIIPVPQRHHATDQYSLNLTTPRP